MVGLDEICYNCAPGTKMLSYFYYYTNKVIFFENRVLRRIFGPKSEEDGSWRKLHNVRVIKSRRMRWAVRVASMGEGRGVYRVLVGRP
jgi:hypothetical protein